MKISALKVSHKQGDSYHYTDDYEISIIDGILQNSNQVISEIYNQNFRKIKRMVLSFNNTMLDPDDIFQEGLTRAIINVQSGKFKLESSFSTYLSSICRNVCLKQLSKKRTFELNDKFDQTVENEKNFEALNAILEIKEQLDRKCREIIDLRFSMLDNHNTETPNKCMPFDEIAEKMQLTTINARQRFKRCLDKLRNLAYKTPELTDYFI